MNSRPHARPSLASRGTAVMLALALELAIVLLIYFLGPSLSRPDKPEPKVFGVETISIDAAEPVPARPEPRAEAAAGKRADPSPQPPVVPPPPEPPVAPDAFVPAPYIVFTRPEYAASDIAKTPARPAARAASDGGTGDGAGESSAGDSEVAEGKGPNGETLYAAEWHVRPTKAQTSTYIPERARQSGWGVIACRTVAQFRVEDCREMGEAPRGSGLAGALRQAAWQFRVRPPRVGGKLMVGSWVSIRIDYTITQK